MKPNLKVMDMRPLPQIAGVPANDNFRNAAKVAGSPVKIHRVWDHNSKGEFDSCDVAVFAIGNDSDNMRLHSYDVGAMF